MFMTPTPTRSFPLTNNNNKTTITTSSIAKSPTSTTVITTTSTCNTNKYKSSSSSSTTTPPRRSSSRHITPTQSKARQQKSPLQPTSSSPSRVLNSATTLHNYFKASKRKGLTKNLLKKEISKLDVITKDWLEYQDKLAYACGLAIENRILAFKIENHQQQHHQANYQCQKNDLLKQVYGCQSKYYIKNRIIPTNPELILDAPGIVDDYYLNLLDWSNKNMVAIGLNEGVYLWNADTGEVNELSNISSIIDNNISSLSWSEDGDHLAVGLSDGDTQIWDILTAQKVRSMSGHATRVGVMAWNRQIIASGCKDSSIWKHDIRLAQHKFAELLGHTGEVCGLKWRSDGEQLASGGNDNKVNIWDAKSNVPKFTKTGHKAA
ncbi:1832_t:CDS:2, partial [Entrophospora sp. SA101]